MAFQKLEALSDRYMNSSRGRNIPKDQADWILKFAKAYLYRLLHPNRIISQEELNAALGFDEAEVGEQRAISHLNNKQRNGLSVRAQALARRALDEPETLPESRQHHLAIAANDSRPRGIEMPWDPDLSGWQNSGGDLSDHEGGPNKFGD